MILKSYKYTENQCIMNFINFYRGKLKNIYNYI